MNHHTHQQELFLVLRKSSFFIPAGDFHSHQTKSVQNIIGEILDIPNVRGYSDSRGDFHIHDVELLNTMKGYSPLPLDIRSCKFPFEEQVKHTTRLKPSR